MFLAAVVNAYMQPTADDGYVAAVEQTYGELAIMAPRVASALTQIILPLPAGNDAPAASLEYGRPR